MTQWVRLHASTARNSDSIPGQGPWIPHAVWYSQINKNPSVLVLKPILTATSRVVECDLPLIFSKNIRWREQDDGGVGGHGVHLSPWIHQEYTFRHRSALQNAS